MSGNRALVLTYHRVASGRDPFGQAVTTATFSAQMEAVSGLAEVVPLRALDRPARGRRVAITFDDGYADNARTAAPILLASGLPATFFIPGRVVADRGEYWWDRLEHLHLDRPPTVPTLTLAFRGRELMVDVRSAAGRLRALKALNRRFRTLGLDEIDSLVEQVRVAIGVEPAGPCEEHAVLTAADLATLAAEPMFEIGSHAFSHTMLSALSAHEQERELVESRQTLEAATGRDVTSLAYPYGIEGAYDAATIRAARTAGYERACTNVGGSGRRREPFRLPRHMVLEWPADAFASRVRDWFEDA